jgi:hypothetical protein
MFSYSFHMCENYHCKNSQKNIFLNIAYTGGPQYMRSIYVCFQVYAFIHFF